MSSIVTLFRKKVFSQIGPYSGRRSTKSRVVRTKSWTEYMQKGDMEMYSDKQYRKALEVYEETKSVTKNYHYFRISSTQINTV